jgi:hypothetical protein
VTTAARWGFTALWATLPLTAGATFADALDERSDAVRTGCSVALWLVWIGVLAASLVPRTPTLTVVRVVAPAAVAATAWALAAGPSPDGLDVLAIAAAVAAAGISLTAWFGDVYVDGDSYGDERRFLLRVPGPLLVAPVPLAWAAAVAGITTGPVLLLAAAWVPGVLGLLVGVPVALVCLRALHQLTQRSLIFVPGGVVLHDLTALTVPVLLRKGRVTAMGFAAADTTALDLTRASLGTALEVRLAEPESLPVVRRTGTTTEVGHDVQVDALLMAPSRPAAVLDTARTRRLIRG